MVGTDSVEYLNPCFSTFVIRNSPKPLTISSDNLMRKDAMLNAVGASQLLPAARNHILKVPQFLHVSSAAPHCSNYLPNTNLHTSPNIHHSTTTVTTKMVANFRTAILSPLLAILPSLPALPRIDVLMFENVSFVLSRTSWLRALS